MSQTIELNIQGMTCAECVRSVTEAIQSVPGAHLLEVGIGTAKLSVDDEKNEPAVIEAVRHAGYEPQIV